MAKIVEPVAEHASIGEHGVLVDGAAARLRRAREQIAAINRAVPGLRLQLPKPTTYLTLDIPEALQ